MTEKGRSAKVLILYGIDRYGIDRLPKLPIAHSAYSAQAGEVLVIEATYYLVDATIPDSGPKSGELYHRKLTGR